MGGARWLVDFIQVDCGSGFIGIRLVTYGGNAWGWVGEGRAWAARRYESDFDEQTMSAKISCELVGGLNSTFSRYHCPGMAT